MNVFRRSILDVVGEVYWEIYKPSMSERALFRLDWLLDVVHRYADSLGTMMDLNQIHFLLLEARDCLCAHSSSSTARTAEMVFSGERGRRVTVLQRNRFNFWLIVDSLSGNYCLCWEGVSKAQTSKLQTSDLENSDLETSDLETSDPLKNNWSCKRSSTWMNISLR